MDNVTPITGFLFLEPIYGFAYNVMIMLYRAFGNDLGLAIIVFTLVLRLATLPFSVKQVQSAEKSREFQEKYKALEKLHGKDKERLSKELAQLQSEYLPSQLGGCLPMILQLVFFFQLYYVVENILRVGIGTFNLVRYNFVPAFAAGEAINLKFLGMDLGTSLSAAANAAGTGNLLGYWPYILLAIFVGITQFASGYVTSGFAKKPDEEKKPEPQPEKKLAKKEKPVVEDLSASDAMQQSMQQMLYILPVLTVVISLTLPSGMSLYWTVTNGFVIIQQLIINRNKLYETLRNKFGGISGLRN